MKMRKKRAPGTSGISEAERELYGGRLRWDQTFVRYETWDWGTD